MDARPDTLLQHLGEEERILGAVVPPIFQTSLFVFDDPHSMWDTMQHHPGGPPFHYSRLGNPTNHIAEQKIASLEKAGACKLFASGMAAISAAIVSVCRAGSHVVMVDTAYGPSRQVMQNLLARFGVTHTLVDGRTVETVVDAIRPETSLIYLESPSSLIFRLQDLAAIAAAAKERGIATACDNTYCGALLQNPCELGVDMVVHSGTKYLNGHSDVVAGVLCTSTERMDAIVRNELALLGGALPPFPAWLLMRGLRTLRLRLAQHAGTADTLAAWLSSHPKVRQVHHVSLPDYPQRDLYLRQMRGSGGLFSFEPTFATRDEVYRFCASLKWFRIGVSWGGHESLAVPIEVHPLDWEAPRWMIRLYCGLEDPQDLIEDLERAMAQV